MRFAIASLLLIAVVPASAGTITYEFTGNVSLITGAETGFGGIKMGDPILIRFVFDTNAPDLNYETDYGEYLAQSCWFQVPTVQAHLDVAGAVMRQYPTFEKDFGLGGDSVGYGIELLFFSKYPVLPPDVFLPTTFPGEWSGYIGMYDHRSVTSIWAGVDTASITPEPTGALVFLGSVALCGGRRRSARSTVCV